MKASHKLCGNESAVFPRDSSLVAALNALLLICSIRLFIRQALIFHCIFSIENVHFHERQNLSPSLNNNTKICRKFYSQRAKLLLYQIHVDDWRHNMQTVYCINDAGWMVTDAARLVVRPESATVQLESRVSFFCRADGNPLPSISWRRNGHVISEAR